MGVYVHFTDDQKYRANNVDLVDFLQRQGEKLIPSGRDKRLEADHSITVRGNEWYDHSVESGGYAIDFVRNFYGLTFPEAVNLKRFLAPDLVFSLDISHLSVFESATGNTRKTALSVVP